MSKTVKRITTIHFVDNTDGEDVYLGYLYGSPGAMGFNLAYSLDDAMDISNKTAEEQLEILYGFQCEYPEDECKLVVITTTIERVEVVMDEGLYKESRQRIALAKLTENDIKALGLMSIFTYIKTKYHITG
jgi:hypothetical protein